MYFWFFLAALMGVMMFDSWSDKAKDKETHVQPSYEALALNFLQFHRSALLAYQNTMAASGTGVQIDGVPTKNVIIDYHDAFNSIPVGVYPIASVRYDSFNHKYQTFEGIIPDGAAHGNPYFRYFQLPNLYKPQANTSSYLYCTKNIDSAGHTSFDSAGCTDGEGIIYLMTVRPFPTRYKGADQFLLLQALAKASDNSRQVGIVARASNVAANGENDNNQPEGAHMQIMSAGRASTTWPYIPDYLAAHYPLFEAATTMGGSTNFKICKASQSPAQDPYSYMVALTIVKGEAITTDYGKIVAGSVGAVNATECGW